jgi:adenosylcobinamide-GDP ribazoletransferase
MRRVSGLLVAARYLTIIPLPGAAGQAPDALGRAAPWFPVVGLGLGVGLAAVDRVVSFLFPPILTALLTITAWKLVTGGLHLDGLADCLDGLMGRDRAQRLAIMRDSRIGVFGALGLIFALLIELIALAELPSDARWRALVMAPAVGRAVPPLLARAFPPATEGGQGAAFARDLRGREAVIAGLVALGASALVLRLPGVVASLVAGLVALGTAAFATRRLGGVTGDVLGAAVEIAELAILLTLVAWTRLGP